jgi:hypothetical protein
MAAHANINFFIHYTSLFLALQGPSGEYMRPKQGDPIFRFINVSLNLTPEREYAGR